MTNLLSEYIERSPYLIGLFASNAVFSEDSIDLAISMVMALRLCVIKVMANNNIASTSII